MTTDTFISTQEAGELIGVNKRTVKRRADHYLKSNDIALAEASDLIEARDIGGGRKKYFVSKEFVLKHLVTQADSPTGSATKDDAFATRHLLQQLETKDLQIKTKDEQLAAKDVQIADQGERLRESHFLLKEAQQLHKKALESKRPLLALRGRDSDAQASLEEGSRRITLQRVASSAAVGFTALVVMAAAVFYFQ